MKPLIGITPDTESGEKIKAGAAKEKIVFLWARYLEAIEDQGGVPVLLPVTDDVNLIRQLAQRLDGFVLAGGAFDIPPEYFGEKPRPWLGRLKPERSWLERALFFEAARLDKPILGICGGMQLINVALGGTLYQDIRKELPGSRDHEQKTRKTRTAHQVTIAADSLLGRIIAGRKGRDGSRKIRVNSSHHQAVKRAGRGLKICAVAPDNVIEAVESERHGFVIGVQWHPETLYQRHKEQARLLASLIAAAKKCLREKLAAR